MKAIASIITLAAGASAFAPSNQGKLGSVLRMSDEAEVEAAPVVEEVAPVVEEVAPVVEEVAPAPVAADGAALALAELKTVAKGSNPVIGYYDPLHLADGAFTVFDADKEATIGFLRQAEIKHGRVAMAAFVGYCVQSNWHFPWAMTTDGRPFPSIDLSPEEQWDAIPAIAKWQIILLVGFLEGWSESAPKVSDDAHYMRGGKPGKFPSFQKFREDVHPIYDLYDPFGFYKNVKEEKKEKSLLAEINNGRLAMIGIMGFVAADAVEGSVPLLKDIAIPYSGQVMSPFEAGYTNLGY